MTDKVQKIREEVVRLREQLQNKVEESDFISGEVFIINYFLTFIDSLQEEPVSEGLGEYINELSKQFPEVSFAKLSRIAVRVAKWKEEQMLSKETNL